MTVRHTTVLLLALAAVLFLGRLGAHDVWAPDEPRYAAVAQSMLDGEGWIVPHFNGKVYDQKPPAFFWLIVASSIPEGAVTPWSARLPSALAALLALVLVIRLGDRLFGTPAGLLAAAVLGSCHLWVWQARTGQIDMVFSVMILLALSSYERAWRKGVDAGFRDMVPVYLWGGLATATKGPMGFLIPLAVASGMRWLTGDAPRLHLGKGLAAAAAVLAAWLIPAWVVGGNDYMDRLVFRQTVVRYLDPWHHYHPPYYFLKTIPLDMLLWTVFLPGALWVSWRRARHEGCASSRFLLLWVLAVVGLFSLSRAKRNIYVLPSFPALALLCGAYLKVRLFPQKDIEGVRAFTGSSASTVQQDVVGAGSPPGESSASTVQRDDVGAGSPGPYPSNILWAMVRRLPERERSLWSPGPYPRDILWALRIHLVLVLILALAGPWIIARRYDWMLPHALSLPLVLLPLALGLAVSTRRPTVSSLRGTLVWAGAASLCLMLCLHLVVLPAFDRERSAAPVARALLRAAPGDEPLFNYRIERPEVIFHVRRPMHYLSTPDEVLAAAGLRPRIISLAPVAEVEGLRAQPGLGVTVRERYRVGRHDLAVLELRRRGEP